MKKKGNPQGKKKVQPGTNWQILLFIMVAVISRFLLAAYGHNYDFESYKIVAEILRHGGNVYAETSRYNYGPVWFLVIGLLDQLSFLFSDPQAAFRFLITSLLTMSDLILAFLLIRHWGLKAGILLLINPLSVIVTGYFSQFDNLAIMLALFGCIIYSEDFSDKFSRNKFLGLILIGISLMTKHLFFLFPLWLAVKEKNHKQKLLALLLPGLLFVISFIPFWAGGERGIIENVVGYNSMKNAPLLNFFAYGLDNNFAIGRFLWVLLLITGAFVFRKAHLKESLMYYLLLLLIFSPSVIHHYLAIVVVPIAVFPNWIFSVYTVVASYILLLDNLGLNIRFLLESAPDIFLFRVHGKFIFNIPIAILFAGLIWTFYQRQTTIQAKHFIKWLKRWTST